LWLLINTNFGRAKNVFSLTLLNVAGLRRVPL